MSKPITWFAVVAVLLATGTAAASTLRAKELLSKGKQVASKGQTDSAFLFYRQAAVEEPGSKYSDEAQFLIGEYYFSTRDYFHAQKAFTAHTTDYPDSPFHDRSVAYLYQIEVRTTEAQALKATEQGDYELAKVLWEDVLAKTPDNARAKRELEEVEEILSKLDFQRREIEDDRRRLDARTAEANKALKEAERLRAEALRLRREADKRYERTCNEYEARLAEARSKAETLDARIASMEDELGEWRDRARKYEALALADPVVSSSDAIHQEPKIIFQGPQADPEPERGEKQLASLLRTNSPTVVVLGEYENPETNALRSELVVGVDLRKPWERHDPFVLKVRVEFTAKAATDGSPSPLEPRIIYFTLADIDSADLVHYSYKKRLVIAVDRNEADGYAVCAYFVEKK